MHHRSRGRLLLAGAAICGVIHAGFTLHWAIGGSSLADTLSGDIIEFFSIRRWLLGAVGALKCVAACAPLLFHIVRWPYPHLSKGACWVGGGELAAWGGVNTATGNLVLLGVLDGGHPMNRAAVIGHARLWDLLFLLWGVCLLAGLIVGVPRTFTEIRPQR